MHKSHSWAVLILLLICTATAMAQKPTLAISDQNVVITGDLSTGLPSFSRTLTVTLTGLAANETRPLSITRTNLQEAGGKIVIDRSSVVIPPVSLQNDKPQDIVISVSNITRPGTYRGEITFWVEPNKAEAQVVKLTIEMKPKIEIKASVPAKVQLVRCSPFPCALTRWLPEALFGQNRKFSLENETVVDLPISLKGLLLRGDNSGELITDQDVTINIPKGRLDARQSTVVEMNISDPNKLRPDRYSGTMRFRLDGYETEPAVSYTLDVRDGPWWALGVLLVGIIFGRLIKSMNSPEVISQLKLIDRLYRLQTKTYSLKDKNDRDVLLRELDKLKQRINAGDEPAAVLTPDLDKIETRINLFTALEQLEMRIELEANASLKQELLKKCLEARQALRQGQIENCQALIKAIETKLLEAEAAAPLDFKTESFVRLLDSVKSLNEEAVKAVKAHQVVPPQKPRWPTRFLAWLSGINLLNAEARYWVVQPALFLLLLVLLALAGLKTLYIDAGASFGSAGIYDYLGLFMWGLSAQVVQTTLQNIRIPGSIT